MAIFGLIGKKEQAPPPPPPKPRTFNMDNIYDVIEYCILKEPENATAIITNFLENNPDQLERRYTNETKPERGANFWSANGATPLMILMKYNQDKNAKLHDYTEDGQRIDAKIAIFEWPLFENIINLDADLNAQDNNDLSALFYTTDDNKDITVKLLENGLDYQTYFNGEKQSTSSNYSAFVHYAIQEFESGKFVRLDDQTAALSHIFYVKASQYMPNGLFKNYKGSDYLLRKRLLVDFEQNAIHTQEGYDGSPALRIGNWRTKDIESFDTYMNQGLIERARAFMDSGERIEASKPALKQSGSHILIR